MGISYTTSKVAERDDSNIQKGKEYIGYGLGLLLGRWMK
jgi:hypothetical protein